VTQPTTTTDPASPEAAPSGTREIPVPPPVVVATGTAQFPRVEPAGAEPVQATGPVDFVPGLPGLGTPPPPPPPPPAEAAAPGADAAPGATRAPKPPRAPRTPQDRAALLGAGLTVVALVLLELGLALRFGAESLWSTVPLWSGFATLATLLGLLPFLARAAGNRLRADRAWKVAAGGLTGVAAFWLLVVLPRVDTDRGFLLTAALAALGIALWVAPARRA
jgi:hypothetical protein